MNIKIYFFAILFFICINLQAEIINMNYEILLYPLGWESINEVNNTLDKVKKNFNIDKAISKIISIIDSQDYSLTCGFLNFSDSNFKYSIASDFLFSSNMISGEGVEYIIFIKPDGKEVYTEVFTPINNILFHCSVDEKIYAPTVGKLDILADIGFGVFCQYSSDDYTIDISNFSNNHPLKRSTSNIGEVIGYTWNKTLSFCIRDIDDRKLTNVVYIMLTSLD